MISLLATGRSQRVAIVLTGDHVGHYAGLVRFGREAANTSEVI
jgi:hypothetical protein